MKSPGIRSAKPDRKTPAPQQQPTEPPERRFRVLPLSPCENLHILIAKRAYELYGERGYRHGSALDDWLEAERGDSQPDPAGLASARRARLACMIHDGSSRDRNVRATSARSGTRETCDSKFRVRSSRNLERRTSNRRRLA